MIDALPQQRYFTSNGTSSKSKIENPMSVVDDDCHSKSSDLENEQELFSPEQEKLFAKRYEEDYNLADPTYIAWLKLNHADRCVSVSSDAALSESTAPSSTVPKSKSSTSSDVLSEILALPSVPPQQKHRNAMNNKAVCVTDMLDDLKLQEAKKIDEKALAEEKRKEKERIRKEKAEKAEERKKEKEVKKKQREELRQKKEEEKKRKEEEKKRKEEEKKRKEEEKKRKEEEKKQIVEEKKQKAEEKVKVKKQKKKGDASVKREAAGGRV